MCYEESFFRMWGRRDARRRDRIENVVERTAPKKPDHPTPAPTAAPAPKRKEEEREAELV